MRLIYALLLILLLPLNAWAQRSFAAASDWIRCDGGDQVAVWLPASTYNGYPMPEGSTTSIGAGAGPDFNRPFTIVGAAIAHFTRDPMGYAVVGHSGVNGDLMTPMTVGPAYAYMSINQLYTPGEHIDAHIYCAQGSLHYVYMTVWFAQD